MRELHLLAIFHGPASVRTWSTAAHDGFAVAERWAASVSVKEKRSWMDAAATGAALERCSRAALREPTSTRCRGSRVAERRKVRSSMLATGRRGRRDTGVEVVAEAAREILEERRRWPRAVHPAPADAGGTGSATATIVSACSMFVPTPRR